MRSALLVILLLALLVPLALPGGAARARQPSPVAETGDLTGITPLPLTGERRAEFEAYVAEALVRFDVPGAAVAVVQDGDVVYLNGFGVRAAGGTAPVTPDTLMMIGSITKPLTTTLAGSLVDDGLLAWDTPLVDLLPTFSVADPELTANLTIHDAFCNCSGIPGLNMESTFASSNLTPETVVTSLADTPPAAPFGQAFIYNNLLIASAGYALGVANGSGSGDIGQAYNLAMQQRVFAPLGMTRTTFDPDAAIATGNYAQPHATNLAGKLQPVPLTAERVLLPYRPAGALWSNARDMSHMLQMELATGVAPGGARVISAANLAETWAPGVAVPNVYGGPPEMAATMRHYGLGWMVGDYRGLRMISHAGGTTGYTSQLAFLPDADLGIVILSNAFSLRPFPLAFEYAVQMRLFELLFDQPADFDAAITALAASAPAPIALGQVDPAALAPQLGAYANANLGEVTLTLRDGRLLLDTGEVSSELLPRADDPAVFLLADPPLSLFSEAYGATVGFGADQIIIAIPASITGPEQRFVFARVADAPDSQAAKPRRVATHDAA
ncbi:MAG: serine hydrolase domain-containing protein [Thermomicrobiales bacterium]